MSTAVPQDFADRPATRSNYNLLRDTLSAVGSLKITCVLFLLGMFIVFVGSLAQARRDVWQVVNQYFRVYVAEVEVKDFFPPSMFPRLIDYQWEQELGVFASFPFPGGWLIGWLLLGNLMAAHISRIRVQGKGTSLWFGSFAMAAGSMLLALIVVMGNQQTGVEQGNTLLSASQIWSVLLGVMTVSVMGLAGAAFVGPTRSRAEKWVLLGVAGSVTAVLVYFAIAGPVNLSSMRILWQLMKACVCSALLLLGCQLLFRRRAGIVLLHLGVAILMISELVVGLYGHESLMSIPEGKETTFARDIREVELAIVSKDGDKDDVIVVPEALLLQSAESSAEGDQQNAVISLKGHGVPFDLRVTEFFRNSQLRSPEPNDDLTKSGMGSFAVPVRLDPVDGMSDDTDDSAAYIEVLDRSTGKPQHKLLTSFDSSEKRGVVLPERVTVDGDDWDVLLRFRRNYRPYTVALKDVRRDTYVGTMTPRNFQSTIVITDHETEKSEEFTLWMNNPLRYRGETFYQSGYHPLPDGSEATTLQLVRNTGWMLPYIGCVVVAFGMFAQFWQTLRRFLSRTAPSAEVKTAKAPSGSSWTRFVPIAVAVLCVAWLGSKVRTPRAADDAMNLYEFGRLPMAGGGRSQPIDSYARSQLLLTSHRSTFKGELTAAELDAKKEELLPVFQKHWPDVDFTSLETFVGEYPDWIESIAKLTSDSEEAVEARVRADMTEKMSAVRWLLDMIARPDRAVRHRVVWIDNDQILSLLKLELRPKELVYSPAEIEPNLKNLEQIDRDARKAMENNQDNRLTALQRRVMALYNTLRRLDTMQQVFQPDESDSLLSTLVETWRLLERLEGVSVPLGVATGIDDDQRAWETVRVSSLLKSVRDSLSKQNIGSRSGLERWFKTQVAAETLLSSLERAHELLQQTVQQQAGDEDVAADAVQKLAKKLIENFDDGYERQLFRLIAASEPGQPMSAVVDGLRDDHVQDVAGEKITQDLSVIFETLQRKKTDIRLQGIRTRLRRLQATATEENSSALGAAINRELFTILLDDLSKRAKFLLYPSEETAAFDASAAGVLGALESWGTGDVELFNSSVSEYQKFLAEHDVPRVSYSGVELEAFFNYFDPFWRSIYLYLTAVLLSFVAWILWPRTLRNTATAMIIVAFVVHSVALWMRMEISGRPPVTSLYSSAIFIGWAIVGASLIIERMLGYGIGNIVGASTGCATLLIAHYLARDEGDTFSVMQAVLDTTFWLATHVVCITLGYGATFLAGFLGLCYIAMSWKESSYVEAGKNDLAFLGKVVYGTLCFALFFSLVGTVLGGLWADDSWGRFWGWDPKENGALIIVMWNALILHARWDKMVRDYGTAVLALGGNIVTAWSWFGVNELRAGLHSYGFTEGRLMMLLGFIVIQLAIILLASIVRPRSTASAT